MPKFIMLVRATAEGESGRPPNQAELDEMGVYNDSLRAAGILESAQGFVASSKGARLTYSASGKPEDVKVTPGPFPLDSMVSGYWVITVKDLDEAIGWAKNVPFRGGGVEIRKIADECDFQEWKDAANVPA